jgi:hypothetical protein
MSGDELESYVPAHCYRSLTVFPAQGHEITVSLPSGLECVGFSIDGSQLYARPIPHVGTSSDSNLVEMYIFLNGRALGLSPPGHHPDPRPRLQGDSISPDGLWTFEKSRKDRLSINDQTRFSNTRALGRGGVMGPAWAPDSHYLLVERWQLRCGLNLDVEVPETLEKIDVRTRKRSIIPNSQCKIQGGVNGWVSRHNILEDTVQ